MTLCPPPPSFQPTPPIWTWGALVLNRLAPFSHPTFQRDPHMQGGCQQAFGALETTEATWARGGGEARGSAAVGTLVPKVGTASVGSSREQGGQLQGAPLLGSPVLLPWWGYG